MSQILEVRTLTTEQTENTINNLCKIRNLSEPKKIFSGKPVFSKENITKYNLPHITKFGKLYNIYIASNDKKENEIFITMETDKFDKQNLLAIIGLFHLFSDKVDVKAMPPKISICPTFVITPAMHTHITSDIIKANYRIIPLTEIYPLIGGKNRLYGITYDYKKIKDLKTYNNKEWMVILDSDKIVKILNAIDGDLIQCKRLICDNGIFPDTQIRRVELNIENINNIPLSGLCINYP